MNKTLNFRRWLLPLLALIVAIATFAGTRPAYAGLELFSTAFPDKVAATTFWEDFGDEYALTSDMPVAASSPWIGADTTTALFAQATDEAHGVATLTCDATTDNKMIQILGDMEWTGLVTSKNTIFYTRLKLSDATQTDFFIGLTISDSTIIDPTGTTLATTLTPTDCIGFFKLDGVATLQLVAIRDSVAVGQSTIATLADDTYVTLELRAQMRGTAGTGRVEAWVNGTYAGEFTSTTLPYTGEEILAPAAALASGNNTGTKVATIDAIGVGLER